LPFVTYLYIVFYTLNYFPNFKLQFIHYIIVITPINLLILIEMIKSIQFYFKNNYVNNCFYLLKNIYFLIITFIKRSHFNFRYSITFILQLH
jgi:hypothetical protein